MSDERFNQHLTRLGCIAFEYIQERLRNEGDKDWELCDPDTYEDALILPGQSYGLGLVALSDDGHGAIIAETNTGQRMHIKYAESAYQSLLAIMIADKMEDLVPIGRIPYLMTA